MHYPLIGITAYEKVVDHSPTIRMAGLHVDYKNAVIEAGGIPVLIPVNLGRDQLEALLDRLDGVLLPGGGDIDPQRYAAQGPFPPLRGIDAERDEMEMLVAESVLARDLPLLAICRGHQLLNVVRGGTLWQDIAAQHPDPIAHDFYRPGVERDMLAHNVAIAPESRLAALLGSTATAVNSLHHQGIRALGDGLIASAIAADGLIEAIEMADRRFVVGVQWHPENIVARVPAMRGLFRGLVAATQPVQA